MVAGNSGHDRFALTRARRALQGVGLEGPHRLEPASSTRNEVHLSERYVVRVNRNPNQRLRREGIICQTLPERRWAPRVLGYAGGTGFDFVVVERKPGIPLSRAWPSLGHDIRRSIVSEFAGALHDLHNTPTPIVAPVLDSSPHLLDPAAVSPVVPILMAVDELLARRQVDRVLLQDIADLVNDHGDALDDYDQRTLIHGDLSLENVMVDINGLSAILDFEWARGGPADLELDVLLRFFRHPDAHLPAEVAGSLTAADFDDVPGWIAEDYPALFSHPRFIERMVLYSIAFDMAELNAMHHVGNSYEMGPMHPVRRLTNLLDGVSPLRDQLARLSLPV